MDDSLRNKMLEALTPVVEEHACAAAKMAAAFLKATGVSPRDMSLLDVLDLSARLEHGAMAASGLYKYIQPETGASEAAALFAANCSDPVEAANAIKYARYYDSIMTKLRHFSPRETIIAQALAAKGSDACKFDVPQTPMPSSPEAKRWAAELNSPLHHLPPVKDASVSREGMDASEDKIRAILSKPMITEDEAATLLSVSTKALSNKRRAGSIPRNIYLQKCKKGKVMYITKDLIVFIENGPQKRKRRQ